MGSEGYSSLRRTLRRLTWREYREPHPTNGLGKPGRMDFGEAQQQVERPGPMLIRF